MLKNTASAMTSDPELALSSLAPSLVASSWGEIDVLPLLEMEVINSTAVPESIFICEEKHNNSSEYKNKWRL